ncbi:hypothetical protein QP585_22430 [Serratia ureilytica]|uniref:hypothetical protein n=1 Tax=Serratia ureilytica TaxID=300181 RepID=UPI0025503093|nr:hypothetical protein [Serratia ureilytica]MDK7595873.1 hypothetical protein [Serratia ureilytica]
MSLKNLIDDAIVLKDFGRNLSALTLLCVGIAATSRKLFPKGTISIEKPTKKNRLGEDIDNKMGDNEAFRLFFNSRLMEVLFSQDRDVRSYDSKINFDLNGRLVSISEIFYKNYRCELVHEARLKDGTLFVQDRGDLQYGFGNAGVGIKNGDLILTHGWCELLYEMVYGATVNGVEFGIKYFAYRAISKTVELNHQRAVMARVDPYASPEIIYACFYDAIPLIRSAESKDVFNEQIKRCMQEGVVCVYGGFVFLSGVGYANLNGEINDSGLCFLKDYFSIYNSTPLN